MQVALIIDPAQSTGWCLMSIYEENEQKVGNIYEYGIIDVDQSSEFQGDHCLDLNRKLQKIIEEHGVSLIAIEDYFFNKKFASGSNVNAAFRTAIHILARSMNIPYQILSITSWKTFINGRKTPTPEQNKKWGKEPAKKLSTQDSLWKKYKFRFPNHTISPKTGKPIQFRYDIVDAVAQAVYYGKCVLGLAWVALSVEPKEDVVFKTPPKKNYSYA